MNRVDPPKKEELARKVKELREQDELTQEEFADVLGLSQPTLSRIEQGQIATAFIIILVLIIAHITSKGGLKAVEPTDRITGKRLKKRREALKLSQAQLAKHLGVSRITIVRWENGIIDISSCLWLSLAMDELERRIQSEEAKAA